jgi:tetratricopeptide (TPR) repeat protein
LDAIPHPAELPPGSRMARSRNERFVGRAAELRKLAAALKAGGAVAITPAEEAASLGGIGKTELASEFVHRYGQFFAGGVHWLSFADATLVPAEIAMCGDHEAMNLPCFADLSLAHRVAAVRAAWEEPVPRLLVLDNCEDPSLLAEWRPRIGGCRILATSRTIRWDVDPPVRQIRLGPLTEPDSIDLLRQFRPSLTVDAVDLRSVAAELGHLPLALLLAGNYLREVEGSVSALEFLWQLRLTESVLGGTIASSESARERPRNVEIAFRLCLRRLGTDDPVHVTARVLLACTACFAPGQPVPLALLLATVDATSRDSRRLAHQAVRRLVGLGFADLDDNDALRLHEWVTVLVRDIVADREAPVAVAEALARIAAEHNDNGSSQALLPLQAHLRHVASSSGVCADRHTVVVAIELAHHLLRLGDVPGFRSSFEQALTLSSRAWSAGHPDTAVSLSNLGDLLREQGMLDAAWSCFERALAISEQVLGAEHPDTANSLEDLGGLLRVRGDPARAWSYFERALAIRQRSGDRYREAVLFIQLSRLATRLHGYAAGVRLAAVCFLLEQEVDHPDAARAWHALTDIGDKLDYSRGQLDILLGEVRDAYEVDRGWAMVRASLAGPHSIGARHDTK